MADFTLTVADSAHAHAVDAPTLFDYNTDDFSLNDGDPPNSQLWAIVEGAPEIQGSALELATTVALGADTIRSVFWFSGDFDVQIDFALQSPPATNSFNAQLRIYIDDTHVLYISAARYSGGKYFQRGYVNGGSWAYNGWSRTNDTGKLKITRTGASVSFETADGAGGFVSRGSNTIGSVGDNVYVEVVCGIWDSNPDITCRFDAFNSNSGPLCFPATAADALHAHAGATPLLTQKHLLAVTDGAHGHTAESKTLTQKYLLVCDEAAHTQEAEAPTPVQDFKAVVQGADHAHGAEAPTLVQDFKAAVQDARHAHRADIAHVIQDHQLTVGDAAHTHRAADLWVKTKSLLAVADATHAHAGEPPVLTQVHLLVVGEAVHAHGVEVPLLSQVHLLVVGEAVHAHSAAEPVPQVKASPQEAVHAHAAAGIVLVENVVLLVVSTIHPTRGDPVVLSQRHSVSVEGGLHVQTAEAVEAAQRGNLREAVKDVMSQSLRHKHLRKDVKTFTIGTIYAEATSMRRTDATNQTTTRQISAA